MKSLTEEIELSARGTKRDDFFLQAHTYLNLHLKGENTHSLTERCTYERFKRGGEITLLEVVD